MIRYRRLTSEGDDSKDMTVEEARKQVENDLAGLEGEIEDGAEKTCQIFDDLKAYVRLLVQKKEGEEKYKEVTDSKQIDEKTKEVLSVPDVKGGI